MRVLIVGGVAGGASCAARLRRLSEAAEIIVFERGPYASFANCGLPYYVGDVIKEEKHLLVATPELFRDRFNIAVRTNTEVTAIHPETNRIELRDRQSGAETEEAYDALVLSPGAKPIRPPIPGVDLDGVFTVRTIPDSRRMRDWIQQTGARQAVIVGGGYIGLEMTENLVERGLGVTIVELQSQLMPILDPEMVEPIQAMVSRKGARVLLNDQAAGFEPADGHRLRVQLGSGTAIETDLVVLAVGVKPEVELAVAAGLKLGSRGGIQVDDRMRTSVANIWAVGDAVEVLSPITGLSGPVPLAGPANRQGRIAADVIMGRDSRFRGVQGTAIVGLFGLALAATGPGEKLLRREGLWDGPLQCEKIYLHPGHHASYYPGASMLSFKLIFSKRDGRILGAQAVGKDGVDKRIDVIAMAIQKEATVFDLEEAELCYAPQFGAAKDPINMAGMIAANVLRGDSVLLHHEDLAATDAFILDVREPGEFRRGHIDGAVNIPLHQLRGRLDELPRDREIWAYCFVGQRSYYAARMLLQLGFRVRNLSGGFRTFSLQELVQSRQGAKT